MSSLRLDHPVPNVRLPRLAWAAAGLIALSGALALMGPWALALWLVPDLGLLAGGRSTFAGDGRLSPRAVRVYNALHALPGPVAVLALGLAGAGTLALGLVWLSHVALDRALGYGLRAPDGSQRG